MKNEKLSWALAVIFAAVLASASIADASTYINTDTSTEPHASTGDSYLQCEPEPAIQELLDRSEALLDACVGSQEGCWLKAEKLLRSAAESLPRNYFVQRQYQSLFSMPFGVPLEGWVRWSEVRQRYMDAATQSPDQAVLLDLGARVLSSDDPQHEKLLRRAAELEPASPWAQQALASLALRDEDQEPDLDAAQAALGRFFQKCPAHIDSAGRLYRVLPDADFWRAPVEGARQLVLAEPARHWKRWDDIWRLQFKIVPVPQHPALRESIHSDVQQLEALQLKQDNEWWRLVQTGYEMAGDAERAAQLEKEILEREPCGGSILKTIIDYMQESMLARREEGFDEQARAQKDRDYYADWYARCPENSMVLREYFAAASRLQDIDPALLTELGEASLEVGAHQVSPVELRVAATWQHAGVQAERVTELLKASEKKLRESETLFAQIDQDLLPQMYRDRLPQLYERAGWHARSSLARQWAKVGNFERSHELLTQLQSRLETKQAEGPPPEPESKRQSFNAFFDVSYYEQLVWGTFADVAEAEERFIDAAVHLRQVYSVRPEIEVAERAKELWLQGGGSEPTWAALDQLASPAAVDSEEELEAAIAAHTAWEPKEEAMPDFQLSDVTGKQWSLEQLKGKTVFVNLWATWCGPCMNELPLVQKLAEQLADDDDMVLVTLNIDDNAGLVAPFLDKNEYDFTTLLGLQYFDALGGGSIPRNWVIDGEGILRAQSVGFSTLTEEEEWLEEVHAQMQAAGGAD